MISLPEFMRRLCFDDDLQLRFLTTPIATLKTESVEVDESTVKGLSDALQGPPFDPQNHRSSLTSLGVVVGRPSKQVTRDT